MTPVNSMDLWILHEPIGRELPIVASLPHSGTYVPLEISATWHAGHARRLPNTDWFLPELYAFLPSLGVTMLEATHSRYVADLNRDPERGIFGSFFRAVIAERTVKGERIYLTVPSDQALKTRIERYHAGYHRELERMLSDRVRRFGEVLLLDLHSFMDPIKNDVCLGDANGRSCPARVTSIVHDAFKCAGFDVVDNEPFNGGYLIRRHAQNAGVAALQIELRHTNYMDTSHLSDTVRPRSSRRLLQSARARLRPVFERALRDLVGERS
jgi:N-formylglutamate amidohydrolase